MQEPIDFTNCKRIAGKAYGGANGKKIAIAYNGIRYMLKFPPSAEQKPTALSYTNSCISEHIASSIFNMLGVKAQETMLGTFEVNGKTKTVCACRDFTADGKEFFDFCSIKNTVLDSETGGTGTELSDILETIDKQQFVDPSILLKHFWDMFVVDTLLGNFDRHNGNWGFLLDAKAGTAEVAPIFDCGSCLLPQADDKIMQGTLRDDDILNARVFGFPTSAIKLNDKKLNYYDFLIKAESAGCNAAVERIYDRINMDQINAFIDEVPYISALQKDFYKHYIAARADLILRPAHEIILSDTQDLSGPTLSM